MIPFFDTPPVWAAARKRVERVTELMSQLNRKPEGPEIGFPIWRKMLFPVHKHEIFNFLLVALLMISLLYSYTTVRIIKDSVIVNAPGCSAQTINFLKGIVIPSSLMIALFLGYVQSRTKKRQYAIFVLGFFAFVFAFYAYVLLPNAAALHPDPAYIAALQIKYPTFRDFIGIAGSWAHCFFYIVADISGNTLLTYAFWLLIMQITRRDDMSRLFPLYSMYGNIVGIVGAGAAGILLGGMNMSFIRLIQLRILTVVIALCGGIILTNYAYNHLVPADNDDNEVAEFTLTDLKYAGYACATFMLYVMLYRMYGFLLSSVGAAITGWLFVLMSSTGAKPQAETAKKKPGTWASIKFVISSKYLLYLAIMTIGYGMCINLAEVTFKTCIQKTAANPQEFINTLDSMYVIIGVTTFLTSILGRSVSKAFGWFGCAIATPVVIGVTSICFFIFVILSDPRFVGSFAHTFNNAFSFLGCKSAVHVAVFIGMAQNVLSKATKYVLFDPTLQMSYMVLDEDLRKKGKLAVDVVGGRFGKAGGALVQSVLIMLTGLDQMSLAPILLAFISILVACWCASVYLLEKEYTRLYNEQDKISK